MTRSQLITAGKIWHVYRNDDPVNPIFEGSKTKCQRYIRENGMQKTAHIGKLIWEEGM